VLVEPFASESPHALAAALTLAGCGPGRTGVDEIVPAACSVLVRVHEFAALAEIAAVLDGLPPVGDAPIGAAARWPEVEILTHYDGPDLAVVSEATGLSVEEVIARHVAARYTVGFIGFAPGFAYLVGGDPALRVPRRAGPRPAVPAGSVGLADEYTGVYPRRSPGGWQLIGRTDQIVFDLAADPPCPFTPGVRVRFVAADRPRTG
jgi:KipI family sensor histidine kinase inhibitor